MASNENQGLQITLIIFVALTIVMSCTTFYLYRKSQQLWTQSEKDKSDATKAMTDKGVADADNKKLKTWMGFAEATTTDAVEKDSKADWEKYAATLPEGERSYRAALSLAANTLTDSVKTLQTTQETVQNLKNVNETREQIKDKQVVEYKNEVDTSRTDLASETTKFNTDRDRIEKEKADLAQKLQKVEADFTVFRDDHQKDMAKFDGDIKLLQERVRQKDRTIAQLRGAEPPLTAGRIVSVNQKRGLVWIDLGELDHLPRQLNFAVYPNDASTEELEKRKGAVEVTQVIGPHLAEARILEDEIADPIIRGDQISTPLWQPGRIERFALAGFLDIDGDRESDRMMVHDMIANAGGLIDLELDDNGKKSGEMSLDTRYLVVGNEKENVVAKVGELKKQAEELGIEQLSLRRFLEHMGWKDMKCVLNYGTTRHEDFKQPAPDGGRKTASGNTSQKFRPRHPRDPRPRPIEPGDIPPESEQMQLPKAPRQTEMSPAGGGTGAEADEEAAEEAGADVAPAGRAGADVP